MMVLLPVVIWLLLSTVGLAISLLSTYEAIHTWNRVKYMNASLGKLAFYQLRRSILRSLVLLIFVTVGILAVSGIGAWIALGLVVAVALIMATEALDWMERLSFEEDVAGSSENENFTP